MKERAYKAFLRDVEELTYVHHTKRHTGAMHHSIGKEKGFQDLLKFVKESEEALSKVKGKFEEVTPKVITGATEALTESVLDDMLNDDIGDEFYETRC